MNYDYPNRKKGGEGLSFLNEIRKNRYLYLLSLPGIIFLMIFAYIPMFGHLIAFKKFNAGLGLWRSPWIGIQNFKFFFQSQDWLRVTFNTIFLNFLFITLGIGIAVLLAIFLNEIRSAVYKKMMQSIIFFPYFISWLVVSLMIFALLNSTDGLINKTLQYFGMDPVGWFQTASLWPGILTGVSVWKMAGYNSVIFLAAIVAISGEYYESAIIDGASRFQQIRYITLPLLRPTIIILVLLGVGRIFYGDFGMIYAIVGDNSMLFPTTDVIDTYTYRALRMLGNFGMASAVALYQSTMGLITIMIFNSIVRKVDPDSRLF
jgi:putative aldouronate transport system permease protein